jgi:hypothetical protein
VEEEIRAETCCATQIGEKIKLTDSSSATSPRRVTAPSLCDCGSAADTGSALGVVDPAAFVNCTIDASRIESCNGQDWGTSAGDEQ